MDDRLLNKYVTGDILPDERKAVVAWMKEDEENEKYVAQLLRVYTTMIWTKEKKAERRVGNGRTLRAFWRAMPVAAMLAMAVYVLYGVYADYAERRNMVVQTYTNFGGKSVMSLPDGTSVWVHSGSTLSHSADFKRIERLVHLEGEAYFDVVHDPRHPFVVQVDDVRIKVYGTKFNVEAQPDSDNILVSLLEGSVSMDTKQESRMLRPGEIGLYDKRSRRIHVTQGDVGLAASWARKELIINNKNLTDIVVLLSKWYGVKINVAPALFKEEYKYTFILRQEPLEEIMRLMSRIHPVTYSFNEDNVLNISAK